MNRYVSDEELKKGFRTFVRSSLKDNIEKGIESLELFHKILTDKEKAKIFIDFLTETTLKEKEQ